jgi:hypothetical protein
MSRLKVVKNKNGHGLKERHSAPEERVAKKPESTRPLMMIGRSEVGQSPEEVETQDGHPVEHRNAGTVKQISDRLAN